MCAAVEMGNTQSLLFLSNLGGLELLSSKSRHIVGHGDMCIAPTHPPGLGSEVYELAASSYYVVKCDFSDRMW